jgi:hypothetical protein
MNIEYPRTFPIALLIVSLGLMFLAYNEHEDFVLRRAGFLISLVFILVAIGLWLWERDKHYKYINSFPYPVEAA